MHRKHQAKQTVYLQRLFLRNKTKDIQTNINQRLPLTHGCGLGRFVR